MDSNLVDDLPFIPIQTLLQNAADQLRQSAIPIADTPCCGNYLTLLYF